MLSNRTIRFAFFAVVIFLAPPAAIASSFDFSKGLMDYVARRFGWEAPSRLQTLQAAVRQFKVAAGPDFPQTLARSPDGRAELPILRKVNNFINTVPYISDIEHWKVDNYWATPVEFVASSGGNCKDYAIAKYMTLKELGVPVERLRITYVSALSVHEAHMVLAYYPTPDADPWILDNMIAEIKHAAKRTDLAPVYSFNDDDLWNGTERKGGGAANVRSWRAVLEKMARERAM